MIKGLRKKFVIVTTSLMVIVFGCFILVNTIYNKYWSDIEIAEMLDWIADSGVFLQQKEQVNEQWLERITEEDKPIVGIVLDKEFNIVSRKVLGSGKDINISESALIRMCSKGAKENKIGGYYYSYSNPDENHILLVIMDSSENENNTVKILGVIALSLLGIIFLILLTLFLSKFVTRPAELSLIREKRFITDASHELKTPLGAISINAQAIKVSEGENLYINNIISESDRMNRLVEKLLTLSKLDESLVEIKEPINMSEICEEMVLTYEGIAFEKKIEFDYKIQNNLILKGNADEIRQLIAILFDNAIKNTPESGEIDINVYEVKKQKYIEIKNTGDGINEEDLPHIFERFYTSHQVRKSNSFGLGLAIAKSIVERHKGKIEVESITNEYTIFKIIF